MRGPTSPGAAQPGTHGDDGFDTAHLRPGACGRAPAMTCPPTARKEEQAVGIDWRPTMARAHHVSYEPGTREEHMITLDDKQVEEVFGLMKHSDSVELKLTVVDSAIRSTADALGMDPLRAEIRQVVFFDTPDLTLSKAGVVVRARRIQGGAGDTVIKLRPVNPQTLPPDVRQSASVKIEVDTMPKGFVCSASMKGKTTADDVRAVVLKQMKTRDLFTKEQRAFYKANAPEGLKMSHLSVLGPINLLKLEFVPDGVKRKFVAELWMYPDGSRILELSTKATPDDAFHIAAETREFLKKKGLDLTAEQQPKTNRALKHFTDLLKNVQAGD
jgi:hypothetical protein